MQALYNDTVLTPLRVAKTTGYLDWDTQPSLFKTYPAFLYRYHFNEIEALKIAEISRCVTQYQTLQGRPYYRLNTPSAGNLHPIELYVQIRGVKGVISGIYHINPKEESVTLIKEIEDDGIEPAVGIANRFKGMLFLISIVPFRSEWKYAKRAIRYCYLDAGHQLGALIASSEVLGQNCTVLSEFDRGALDDLMGFGEEEFSCIAVAVGGETEKSVKPLKKPMMQVAPVDYIEGEQSLPELLSAMRYEKSLPVTLPASTLSISSLLKRRSARQFVPSALGDTDTKHFLNTLQQFPETLEPYAVVLKSEALPQGIYKADHCLCEANFEKKVAALMVDQHFLSNAAMVVIFTAGDFTSTALIQAGAAVHRLHLDAQERGLGCTGIGAFYDLQVQKFLGTQNSILYVCAIGAVS